MLLKKNKIYLFLFLGCLAGYSWLYAHLSNPSFHNKGTGICILKHTTGIPCPSCGSTRAVLSILHGNLLQALHWNPLGFLLFLFLILFPAWMLVDLLRRNDSIYRAYTKTELLFRQKKIAIPVIALILLNWYWNIHKGL
jgi:hypothetical protein